MRIASITGKGGRPKNEDSIGKLNRDGLCCMVVADGLGGHGGGDIASSIAVDTVLQSFNAAPDVSSEAVRAYVEAAQAAILDMKETSAAMSKIATTIAVVVANDKNAVMAYCGDSRIYRIRGKLIQEVTDDHSVSFAAFCAGEIRYTEIRHHPDRSKLLHSLGTEAGFHVDVSDVIKIGKNDKFLLCSDGFWEYVTEDFMEETLKYARGPRDWLVKLVDERRRSAPDGSDNYSAIAFFAR